ncbi:jg1223 [Pararge aegeria aegeria]|uniref:Jg1223 protein n=1 Tax=Pararge aegeria aegeria TaxID=348720 RepID=A0A8S4RBK2_9NEOP|nr:jg1223 [Pararge aegeria aegeria]
MDRCHRLDPWGSSLLVVAIVALRERVLAGVIAGALLAVVLVPPVVGVGALLCGVVFVRLVHASRGAEAGRLQPITDQLQARVSSRNENGSDRSPSRYRLAGW